MNTTTGWIVLILWIACTAWFVVGEVRDWRRQRALRNSPTLGVLREVFSERAAQDRKWGEQNHPDGTGFSWFKRNADRQRAATDAAAARGDLTWAHILLEEVWEALAEDDVDNLADELIQVAAVCTVWVECIDRRVAAEAVKA